MSQPESNAAERSDRFGHRAAILLASHDDDARAQLARALRTAGYDVETAADGVQAMRRVRMMRWGLVVTEIGLPEVTGLQLLTYFRRRAAAPRVLALAASNDPLERHNALGLGAAAVLVKPVDEQRLLELVREYTVAPLTAGAAPRVGLANLPHPGTSAR